MIPFHRLLIGTAILFCAGFSLWSLARYGATDGRLWFVLFATFLLAAVALAVYLMNLRRFLGRG
jgi:hypothetical protein